MNKQKISLIDLKDGQLATIVGVHGGAGVKKRLEALGVRLGKSISKMHGHFRHGPVTVKIGHTQLAIGHGMAAKIIVDLPAGRQGLNNA